MVHDYLDHNYSRAEIEDGRSRMSEGGRKGGKASPRRSASPPLKPTLEGSAEERGEELSSEGERGARRASPAGGAPAPVSPRTPTAARRPAFSVVAREAWCAQNPDWVRFSAIRSLRLLGPSTMTFGWIDSGGSSHALVLEGLSSAQPGGGLVSVSAKIYTRD